MEIVAKSVVEFKKALLALGGTRKETKWNLYQSLFCPNNHLSCLYFIFNLRRNSKKVR